VTPAAGPDETVRLRPILTEKQRRRSLLPLAGGLAGLAAIGGGLAVLLRPPAGQPPAPPLPAAILPPLATEADILSGGAGDGLIVSRLSTNPAITVLDFPDLAMQARMLNRIAALTEKAGLPRDRLLDDVALAVATAAGGGTPETFFYGHNYRASDLVRFFALAERDGIALTAEEVWLRERAVAWEWRQPTPPQAALVSIPRVGAEPWLDRTARATMLRHELSHGQFFTDRGYAAHVWSFWRDLLTERERADFRTLLASVHYDPNNEEVIANEAHAFLFHTADPRFFQPHQAGLSTARADALRAAFLASMPAGWLRDAMRGG